MTSLALDASSFWSELGTDWVILDCELMPWSAKARQLIRDQYAAVGAAADASLPEAVRVLEATSSRGIDTAETTLRYRTRAALVGQYAVAYRRYCWPVASVADLWLAPFHILATEGAVHVDKDHRWHMETASAICAADDTGVLFATPYRTVELTDAESEAAATGTLGQRVASATRVRARRRGTRALRPRRPATSCARVRVRRSGAGERAGGSATVISLAAE